MPFYEDSWRENIEKILYTRRVHCIRKKNTYQNMFMNRLSKTDLMEANSYLLKTVYSLWHDHSLLHYSYKQTDIPVYTSGTDTWSHSLFPQTHCHMLLINMIIKVKKNWHTIRYIFIQLLKKEISCCSKLLKVFKHETHIRIHLFCARSNLYPWQQYFPSILQNNTHKWIINQHFWYSYKNKINFLTQNRYL